MQSSTTPDTGFQWESDKLTVIHHKIIGLLVLEKFLRALTIYGHGGHLGHVTWTILNKL